MWITKLLHHLHLLFTLVPTVVVKHEYQPLVPTLGEDVALDVLHEGQEICAVGTIMDLEVTVIIQAVTDGPVDGEVPPTRLS